jgi:hypothetical protein
MSWRTEGNYRGLSEADRAWLTDFDRSWDTAEEGRSYKDLFEKAKGSELPQSLTFEQAHARHMLEMRLIQAAQYVNRCYPPIETVSGWRIYMRSHSKKVHAVHFKDRSDAMQAYLAIKEICLWFQ